MLTIQFSKLERTLRLVEKKGNCTLFVAPQKNSVLAARLHSIRKLFETFTVI
jgi:hypothetical protein